MRTSKLHFNVIKKATVPAALPDFLKGGGETGTLTRAYDWENSPLGPPAYWPQSLRVSIRLMLTSGHPMLIFWGPDHIQFYNDAYARTLGPERHPSAIGQRGKDCWAEIWHVIGPMTDMVMSGQGTTWDEDRLIPVTRNGKLEDVWWTFSYGPIDLDDRVGGVLVVCNDVTKHNLAQQRLVDHSRYLESLFTQAPGFMAILKGPRHVFQMTNLAYRTLLGNRDYTGRTVDEAIPEAQEQGFIALLDKVYSTGVAFVGKGVSLKIKVAPDRPMKQAFVDFVYQPILEPDGSTSGIFVEGNDVTHHVENEQYLKMMNQELRHRVKNTLSIVNAIASQSLPHDDDRPHVHSFRNRIVALANAHDLLTAETFATARIDTVVGQTIAPFAGFASRIRITGPEIFIGSKQTVSLAIALHELVTNSVKYGALKSQNGTVDISWNVAWLEEQSTFTFTWAEKTVDGVLPPARLGLGSKLIKTVLQADFGGTCTLDFAASGLVCVLTTKAQNLNRDFSDYFQSHAAARIDAGF